MNEEKKSLQSEVESLVKNDMPFKGEHPLNMLDNQADPLTKPKFIIQKPIRTYEADIAEAIANKKTSVLNIAIEEKKREEGTQSSVISNRATTEPKATSKGLKKFLMLLMSIILICGGIGGGYYLYLQSPLAIPQPEVVTTKVTGIIKPDSQRKLELNSIKKSEFHEKVRDSLFNGQLNNGKINELLLTNTVGSTTNIISGPNFLDMLGISAPDSLNRSLLNKWMIGTYDSESGRNPFIILTSDFFQNTFAGMLKWEKDMPDEMAIVFDYKDRARPLNGTSTQESFYTIRGKFEDRTIMNRDVREFINENGELLILYSFINKDTLIITNNESTLSTMIQKIEKQSYLR